MAWPMETGEGDPEATEAAPPALGPYLLACAAAALWIDFGSIHRDQHSDSTLHVLNSLYCWTPFMWEQDRFGMLVPLLATPLRHPMANLLFQVFATTFCGLAVFFLLARYAIRDASYPAVGTLGAAAFLALTPHYYRFDYLVNAAYYAIGLVLALGGLILLEPGPVSASWRRRLGALGLVATAHWVNCATALILGPFVLIRGALDLGPSARRLGPLLRRSSVPLRERLREPSRRAWRSEAVRALVVLGVGYAIGQQLTWLVSCRPTDLTALPAWEWPRSWWGLARESWLALWPPLWPAALALEAVAAVVGSIRSGRRGTAEVRRAALAMLATAVVLALLMGTRVWVKINVYAFRYLFPSALLAQTAVASLAVSAIGGATARRWARAWSPVVATAVLLAASAWSYGRPSLAGVRRDVDRRCGALTEDLLDSGCTFLAGDYWAVWIAVFHANLALRERGESRMIWGVTERASPSFRLWKGTPMDRRLVGIPVGDGHGERWLQSFQFPALREVEVRPTIRVLRPVPPPRFERAAPR